MTHFDYDERVKALKDEIDELEGRLEAAESILDTRKDEPNSFHYRIAHYNKIILNEEIEDRYQAMERLVRAAHDMEDKCNA